MAYVVTQMHHYFDVVQMINDPYLCSRCDPDGWVPLAEIFQFERLKNVSIGDEDLERLLEPSPIVEVISGHVRCSKWLVVQRKLREARE